MVKTKSHISTVKTIFWLFLFVTLSKLSSGKSDFIEPVISEGMIEYYNLVREGYKASLQKEYDSASNCFYKAFSIHQGFEDHLTFFVVIELRRSKPNSKHLKKYLAHYELYFGNAIRKFNLLDTITNNNIPSVVLEYINKNHASWQREFQSNLNLDFILAVRYMMGQDQFIRSYSKLIPYGSWKDNTFFDSLAHFKRYSSSLMRKTDSLNREALLSLLVANKQFPVQKGELGSTGFYDFYILTRHCFAGIKNDSLKMAYKDIFTKAFNDNKISNHQYASLIDYTFAFNVNLGYRELQYWLIPQNRILKGQNDVIYDLENIDDRRAKIGLLPLGVAAELKHKVDSLPHEYRTKN